MAAKKKTVEAGDGRDFEEAMEALEEIVEAMESDRMPLAELLTKYDEGTQLLKLCQTRIDEAQAKIEIIARKADGEEVELSEFDASGVSEEGSGGSGVGKRKAKQSSKVEGEEIELL
ncbi:MAG: exodeoxyribonuclease VII small subunit [Verrucomicrobiota bacterium]